MGSTPTFDYFQITYVDSTHVLAHFREHVTPFGPVTITSPGNLLGPYMCSGGSQPIDITATAVGADTSTIVITLDPALDDGTLYTFSINADSDNHLAEPQVSGYLYAGDGSNIPGVHTLTTPGGTFSIGSATGIDQTHVDVYFTVDLSTTGGRAYYLIDGASIASAAVLDGTDLTLVHLTLNTVISSGPHIINYSNLSQNPPSSFDGITTYQEGDDIDFYTEIPPAPPPEPIDSPANGPYRKDYNRTGKLRPFNDAQRMVRKRVWR